MVAPLAEYVYRDANGEPYLLVRKHLDGAGKKQFPQFHWDGTQWLKGKPAGPKIPYRLPELLAAPTAVVYFVEGEKDADTLAKCVSCRDDRERRCRRQMGAGADAILQGPARRDPARRRRTWSQARSEGREGPP